MRSVQVGVDGSVFGVTTQQGIVRYNGTNLNTWQALPGHVKSLAVASSNLVIGTSYIEGIFRSLHLFSRYISRISSGVFGLGIAQSHLRPVLPPVSTPSPPAPKLDH